MAYNGFGEYFEEKGRKLIEQQHDEIGIGIRSNIFKDMVFHATGYLNDPSSAEIQKMIVENGGIYSHFLSSSVTHLIATQLSYSRYKSTMTSKKLEAVKPEWIIRCLKEEKICKIIPQERPISQSAQMSFSSNQKTLTGSKNWVKNNSSASSDFVSKFYQNSRLHHLSYQKQFVVQNYSFQSTDDFDEKVVFHVDMDCFFASVSIRDHPELVDKPVGICHSKNPDPNSRSSADIASCNYVARNFGVKNGMLLSQARVLCPDLVLLPYEFEKYKEATDALYQILSNYADGMKPVSCDESYIEVSSRFQQDQYAEYNGEKVDFSKNAPTFKGDIIELAFEIYQKIKSATGCNASIGIGSTSFVARMATFNAKPCGCFQMIGKNEVELARFIDGFKMKSLQGIGYSSCNKLFESFVSNYYPEETSSSFTVGQFRSSILLSIFGSVDVNRNWFKLTECRAEIRKLLGEKMGTKIFNIMGGLDESEKVGSGCPRKDEWMSGSTKQGGDSIGNRAKQKSVSAEINWGIRFENRDQLEFFLSQLLDEAWGRLFTDYSSPSKPQKSSSSSNQTRSVQHITAKVRMRHPDYPIEPVYKVLGCGKCVNFNESISLIEPVSDKKIVYGHINSLIRRVRTKWWTKYSSQVMEKDNSSPESQEELCFLRDLRGIGIQFSRISTGASKSRRLNFPVAGSPSTKVDRTGWKEIKAEEIDWNVVDTLPEPLKKELMLNYSPSKISNAKILHPKNTGARGWHEEASMVTFGQSSGRHDNISNKNPLIIATSNNGITEMLFGKLYSIEEAISMGNLFQIPDITSHFDVFKECIQHAKNTKNIELLGQVQQVLLHYSPDNQDLRNLRSQLNEVFSSEFSFGSG